MAGEIGFFELDVENAEKGRRLYEALFKWRFEPGPSVAGWAIATPGVPGGMHGGDRGAAPYVFFVVDDVEAATARVRELGGGILEMDVEGDADCQRRFGRFKLCTDDQGSPFNLHQRPA